MQTTDGKRHLFTGSINGIGNVIGDHSQSNVEIVFNILNRVVFESGKTQVDYNPRHDAVSPPSFMRHPDALLPELEHLIGHRAELTRLFNLYERASQENKGALIFVTGQRGYGTKALGRLFVDFVRRSKGLALITRFWSGDVERYPRRDPRWRADFENEENKEIFEYAPDVLKTPDLFPFWGLLWQLFDQKPEARLYPLPASVNELPSFFRMLITPAKPTVILLEDFEFASPVWHHCLNYLLPEMERDLPLLVIATFHSEKLVSEIPAEKLTEVQRLALRLAQQNRAEVYHLSRLSQQDVAEYLGNASKAVIEKLHYLSSGLPMLVQELWKEWRNKGWVTTDEKGTWQFSPDSILTGLGSGRDYLWRILDDLWPGPDEAPWNAETMMKMLVLAAREGFVFTPEAVARAFQAPLEKLIYGLEYLLDEEDDPGLVKDAGIVRLSLPSANWHKEIEQFAFSPALVWYVLREEDVPAERLEALAEGLRQTYWPFPEQCAQRMADLYERAGLSSKAKSCRDLLRQDDRVQTQMSHAEFLLSFSPISPVTLSRVWSVAKELAGTIPYSHPQWGVQFTASAQRWQNRTDGRNVSLKCFTTRADASMSWQSTNRRASTSSGRSKYTKNWDAGTAWRTISMVSAILPMRWGSMGRRVSTTSGRSR